MKIMPALALASSTALAACGSTGGMMKQASFDVGLDACVTCVTDSLDKALGFAPTQTAERGPTFNLVVPETQKTAIAKAAPAKPARRITVAKAKSAPRETASITPPAQELKTRTVKTINIPRPVPTGTLTAEDLSLGIER